jgi:hypothetical protein
MHAVKPREDMTRQEVVSFVLRQCALLCDPRHGHLKSLAEAIGAHEVTVSVWIGQGYVPEHQVYKLQKKFGEQNAPLDDLCPVEFRRS